MMDAISGLACGGGKSAEAAAASEKLFEEVAEAGSLEMKFPRAAASGFAPGEAVPAGGRRTWLVPVLAQLVILFPLFGIAEHFVSFVDLLEFGLSLLFVLGHVGMIFPGQGA